MKLMNPDEFYSNYCKMFKGNVPEWELDMVAYIVSQTEKVDAEPVVRCKDCKQARKLDRSNEEERIYIDECLWCMSGCKGVLPYEYCSDGERRDTND